MSPVAREQSTAQVQIPVGGTITYVLQGGVAPSAPAGTLAVSAELISPSDVLDSNVANNSGYDVDTLFGNNAPIAAPQSVGVVEDGSASFTLGGSDPDGDAITYVIEGGPAHGVLSGVAPNMTYTPNANYTGGDGFTFRVSDSTLSSVATVTIAVTPVEDAPVSTGGNVTTSEDVPIGIVLSGADADGDPLTYTVTTAPARGTLSGTGAFRTYTPQANQFGVDSFTFVVSDGRSQSATATVNITVSAVNDAPVVLNSIPDLAVNGEDPTATVELAAVFSDVETPAGLILGAISSDPSLVAPSLSGTSLGLQLANRSGTATVTVRATDSAGAFVDESFLVVIARPGVRLFVSDASRGEGSGITFMLSLSAPSSQPVTVNYTTADLTATAGLDYSASTGTITFAANVTTRTITVATVADVIDEDDESLRLLLSSAVGAILDDTEGIGVIVDNDATSLRVSDITVSEGSGGMTLATFSIVPSVPSARDVSVDFATAVINASAVAGLDFVSRSGRVTFPAGSAVPQEVTVEIFGDLNDEPSEAFSLALSAAVNASISRAVARATIVDDDDPPTVSIDDVSLEEGQSGTKAFVFTVTLSRASGYSTRVRYDTADGTAVAGSDYTARSGELVFAPGVTTKTISIAVVGDTVPEPNETFLVNLHTPLNLTIATGQGVGTIRQDEPGS